MFYGFLSILEWRKQRDVTVSGERLRVRQGDKAAFLVRLTVDEMAFDVQVSVDVGVSAGKSSLRFIRLSPDIVRSLRRKGRWLFSPGCFAAHPR